MVKKKEQSSKDNKSSKENKSFKKELSSKKESDKVLIDGEEYKKEAFMVEDDHPAIGRILIVDGKKFKVMDGKAMGSHRNGTYIKRLTEEDEERMREYDELLDDLSEKLVSKVDVKRMIKENIRSSPIQEIKTGLYILKEENNGAKVEANHKEGCYQLDFHLGKQTFSFVTGLPEMFNSENQFHDFRVE